MFSRFQCSIPVIWPAKAQETEFDAIQSMGKRNTASSSRRPKKRRKSAKKAPKKRQNHGNLVIIMFSLFQHWIPVKWPAKAQEYEFGAIRSMGKRRTASSSRRQKSAKKRQNRGNLLIMMFSRFHPSIPVECLQKPKKPSLVQFGQWVSPGQRRRLDGHKKAPKKRPNR